MTEKNRADLFAIAVSVVMFSMTGCGPNVERITDPNALAKLAIEANAGVSKSSYVKGQQALQKLIRIDQTFLPTIAEEAHQSEIRRDAIQHVTDPEALARIALAEVDNSVSRSAYDRLTGMTNSPLPPRDGPGVNNLMTAGPSKAHGDFAALVTFREVSATLPEEHRKRLTDIIWKTLRLLSSPPIKAQVGFVENIRVNWEPRSATYSRRHELGQITDDAKTVMNGEAFTLSITLSKGHRTFTRGWETMFPSSRDAGPQNEFKPIGGEEFDRFCDCTAVSREFLATVLGQLPPASSN